MTETALFCGAGGLAGSHLVKRSKPEGFRFRWVDLKSPDFAEAEACTFVAADPRSGSAGQLTANMLIRNKLGRPSSAAVAVRVAKI